MSGGRDHIWPFTTDWASCVAPLSSFAHSIHLVTSGDVSPRSQWCTQLTQQTITNQYAHQRCWLQVHSAGSQSYGQFRIVCTSSSCALLHASQGHCNSAPFVGSLSKVPFIHIFFSFWISFSRFDAYLLRNLSEIFYASIILFLFSAILLFFLLIVSPVPEIGSCCLGIANGFKCDPMTVRTYSVTRAAQGKPSRG